MNIKSLYDLISSKILDIYDEFFVDSNIRIFIFSLVEDYHQNKMSQWDHILIR